MKNNKLEACNTAISQLKEQLATKDAEAAKMGSQINDYNNLIKQMQEQKNKDVKNADE